MGKINVFKVEAYEEEFPFLGQCVWHCREDLLNAIEIKKVDRNLLMLIPERKYRDQDIHYEEVIYFADENEKIISKETVNQSGFYNDEKLHGETILEAIYRFGIVSQVAYIIVSTLSIGFVDEDDYAKMVVYKAAQEVNLKRLIKREKKKALAEVKAEADF